MSFDFKDLNTNVRELMLDEIESDIKYKRLTLSSRLTPHGQNEYPHLLKQAVISGNEATLANRLKGLFNQTEKRKKPSGGFTDVSIPSTANITLAESEFNRFFIRGLCSYVLSKGADKVEVYRAKKVQSPKPESEQQIGKIISARDLLNDLRNHVGIDTALGIPSNPNSGLSIKQIVADN